MFEFHTDSKRYFDMQLENAEEYVIPFIEKKIALQSGSRILEIGCGEGGVLAAFIKKDCTGVGVELYEARLELANELLQKEISENKVHFIAKDIYEASNEELGGKFKVIILKDVIEHIHDQKKLLKRLHDLLLDNGVIFLGFPPWQMPFGGHQQMCRSKLLSKLPYYHLLPKKLYRWILKKNNEPVEALMEIRETGISIERFEKIVKQTNYCILHKNFYLINPIYKYKFGLKPRKQIPFLKSIPYIRDYFTTCVYYLITPNKQQ
ncbi:MAG: methyltransferase domain-containing protein [Bacteroidota bacterium]|nr:methyltransferase domain-containing protein [Bacteroidota bacterium]